MPTREQKRVAAKVWMVHGKPDCKSHVSAGKDPRLSGFGGRLRQAAETDDEVTLHYRDGISYLTFNKACKWDKAARWAQGAMGNCKIKLTVRPAPQLDQLQVPAERVAPGPGPGAAPALALASASASVSALASAPASAPTSSQCARHAFDEFITDHAPGNLYIGNVVSAYPGFC